MRVLLDANTCIAYLHRKQPHVEVRVAQALSSAEAALCSIVKAELLYGARRSAHVEENLASLATFFGAFPSLSFDDRAAEAAGRVRAELARAGTPIGPHDVLIAAIALANDLTLVTNNTREFARVAGLRIEDWIVEP